MLSFLFLVSPFVSIISFLVHFSFVFSGVFFLNLTFLLRRVLVLTRSVLGLLIVWISLGQGETTTYHCLLIERLAMRKTE